MLARPAVVTLTVHGIGPAGHELAPGEERTWVDIGQFEQVLDRMLLRAGN